MALNVKVNQKAKLRIYNIAEYLEEEYSMQTARNFVQTVYKTIDKVAEHPAGKRHPQSSVRDSRESDESFVSPD